MRAPLTCYSGQLVKTCGIVPLRQQLEIPKEIVVDSLKDETDALQVITSKRLRDEQRQVVLEARPLAMHGTWPCEGRVQSLLARHLQDMTALPGRLRTANRTSVEQCGRRSRGASDGSGEGVQVSSIGKRRGE